MNTNMDVVLLKACFGGNNPEFFSEKQPA